jgi:hypothetical protein
MNKNALLLRKIKEMPSSWPKAEQSSDFTLGPKLAYDPGAKRNTTT